MKMYGPRQGSITLPCILRVFYGHSEDFFHTCLCFYYACGNIQHTEYSNNTDTIDSHTVL